MSELKREYEESVSRDWEKIILFFQLLSIIVILTANVEQQNIELFLGLMIPLLVGSLALGRNIAKRSVLQHVPFDPDEVSRRYEEVRDNRRHVNCFSAALYLSGVLKKEKHIEPDQTWRVKRYFEPVAKILTEDFTVDQVPDEAVIVAMYERDQPHKYYHMALVNPEDKTQIIQRLHYEDGIGPGSYDEMIEYYDEKRRDALIFLKNKIKPKRE